MLDFSRIAGFDWNEGNDRKSVAKHGVTKAEAEQMFLNEPLLVVGDTAHSAVEPRYHALGRSDAGRLLHATFTLRREGTLIRIISARSMTERKDCVMRKKAKTVPKFANEARERTYWESRDSSEHVDWNRAERARFPNLKPSTTAISLRLPMPLLERIKIEANKRDVPYQSLIKTWLAEKVG